MILGAAAGVIRAYSKLVSDVDKTNNCVIKIKEAARAAKIDDPLVPQGPGQRWNVVLHNWSKKIGDDFENCNKMHVVEDALIAQQVTCLANTLASVDQKVGNIEILVSLLPTLFIHSNKLMAEQNKLLRWVVSQKHKEIAVLKQKLGESPPHKRRCMTSHESSTDASAKAAIPDNSSPLVAGPPAKKLESNLTLEELLDGISKVLTTIGGISVKDAFVEMRKAGRFISLC
jgi:hypothetical protein